MKQALENNCLKGCLIYVVVLVAILVLSAIGLGGISARFGGGQNAKPVVATANATPGQPAISAAAPTPVAPASHADQAAQPAAPAPAAPIPTSAAPVPPPVQADQSTQAAPVPAGNSAPQVQVQGGVISGQASVPFVIVQPGDTLWGIAISYGTKVDTLRSINKLAAEQFIKPGQVIYLPGTAGQTQAPAPVQDVPPPVQPSINTGPGAASTPLPSMPSTGVNARP